MDFESGIEILDDGSNVSTNNFKSSLDSEENSDEPPKKSSKLTNPSCDVVSVDTKNISFDSIETNDENSDTPALNIKVEQEILITVKEEEKTKSEHSSALEDVDKSLEEKTESEKPKSKLFSGVRFYEIQTSSKYIELLIANGAVQDKCLSDLATHVIAGMCVDLYHTEATQAADLYDKTVVCEDWVEACLKYSTLLPLHAYRIHRKRLFAGMKICLSKLMKEDRNTLHFLITHYGGNCTLKLDRSCTHLLTGSSEGRKYDRAVKCSNIEVVAPDWITDSIKAHQALEPKNFSPNRLVDSVESGYLHAIDSVLTGTYLGKTPSMDMKMADYASHMAGLATKATTPTKTTNRGKKPMQKDGFGRLIKSTGTMGGGVYGAMTLSKKIWSKRTDKTGGFFGSSGSISSLQKSPHSANSSSASAAADNLNISISTHPPLGSKFYGHDPDQHIPPECCLIGCRLLFVDCDYLAASHEIEIWKQVAENYCGFINSAYNTKLTHVVCTTQSSKAFKRALHDSKRIVTPYWLNEVIRRKENFAPNEAIHFPVPFVPSRNPLLQGKVFSVTGFSVEEREKLKTIFYILGVKYSAAFNQTCFALICRNTNGEKVRKAQEWSIPIYNVQWLSDLLIKEKYAIENSSANVYQNYESENPFLIDVTSYKELYRFMVGWTKPMKVNSSEIRKKSPYWEYSMLKQKQAADDPTSAAIRRIRQTNANADGGHNKEYVLFAPSRPSDQMPKVVFTGFDNEKLEKLKLKLFSLGGMTATTMSECTHICAPTILRTVKFLIGMCTAEHFVTNKWIEDSFDEKWWKKETEYIPVNEKLEKFLGFRMIGSLKRAKQKKILSGYRVYVTPGVEPTFGTLQLIVEAAGGKMLRVEPESLSHFSSNNLQCIIISCEKDIHLCVKYKWRNFGVYSVELILTGCLTQELELERFELKVPEVTTPSVGSTNTCSHHVLTDTVNSLQLAQDRFSINVSDQFAISNHTSCDSNDIENTILTS